MRHPDWIPRLSRMLVALVVRVSESSQSSVSYTYRHNYSLEFTIVLARGNEHPGAVPSHFPVDCQ